MNKYIVTFKKRTMGVDSEKIPIWKYTDRVVCLKGGMTYTTHHSHDAVGYDVMLFDSEDHANNFMSTWGVKKWNVIKLNESVSEYLVKWKASMPELYGTKNYKYLKMKLEAYGNTVEDAEFQLKTKRDKLYNFELLKFGEIRTYGNFELGYKIVQDYEIPENEL
jgi:hypothetical protein